MKMIKMLSEDIRHNIEEAKDKIGTAYKLKEKDKAAADWYKMMAVAHMDFNSTGHNNVTRLISDAKQQMDGNPMMPGMIAVYEDLHADIMKEAAEVNAMIAGYSR